MRWQTGTQTFCRDVLVASLIAWLVLFTGCAGREQDRPRAKSSKLGAAVARVDGDAIMLSEVQELCAQTGLAPRDALDRLVSERLLAQYASAQGYGELRSVEHAARQAGVRALLTRELEAPTAPTEVEARHTKLDCWLGELAKQTTVRYDEPAIQQALAQQTR